MAAFSSSGPLVDPSLKSPDFTNDILKPDVTAPGVALFSAAPSAPGTVSFNIESGTSMATPLVAGIAALIVQKNPLWSPAAVKSALMTTATTWDNTGGKIRRGSGDEATPFNYGSGHVDAARVLDPGLVYDVAYEDYVKFLWGVNKMGAKTNNLYLTQSKVSGAGSGGKKKKMKAALLTVTPIPAYALNLPNICVSRMGKSVTLTRVVTNVGATKAKYKLTLVQPDSVKVTVKPTSFTIAPKAKQLYTVTIRTTKVTNTFSFGSLTWSDGDHNVTSVIAVQPV